jgi:hypothetical protein
MPGSEVGQTDNPGVRDPWNNRELSEVFVEGNQNSSLGVLI